MTDQQRQQLNLPLIVTNDEHDNSKITSRQALPLEWTRVKRMISRKQHGGDIGNSNNGSVPTANEVKRKRSRSTGIVSNGKNNIENDCIDMNCRRCAPQGLISEESDPSTFEAIDGNHTRYHFSGKVIFCLPDQDCEWFQGYYFPFENNDTDILQLLSSQHNPSYYGMLCTVKADLDECLQCTAGGYREIASIQMTLLNDKQNIATSSRNSQDSIPHPKRINVSNVTWIGGDMMNLYKTETNRNATTTTNIRMDKNDNDILPSVSVVRMQTTTLFTGSDGASPHVQRYFHKHLCYMMDAYNDQYSRDNAKDSGDDNMDEAIVPPMKLTNENYKQVIEQLMPDVAIVVGTMDLWMI